VRVAASALVLAAVFGVPAETFDSFIVAPRMANVIAEIRMICDLREPATLEKSGLTTHRSVIEYCWETTEIGCSTPDIGKCNDKTPVRHSAGRGFEPRPPHDRGVLLRLIPATSSSVDA
jgi:hypothetical protein